MATSAVLSRFGRGEGFMDQLIGRLFRLFDEDEKQRQVENRQEKFFSHTCLFRKVREAEFKFRAGLKRPKWGAFGVRVSGLLTKGARAASTGPIFPRVAVGWGEI